MCGSFYLLMHMLAMATVWLESLAESVVRCQQNCWLLHWSSIRISETKSALVNNDCAASTIRQQTQHGRDLPHLAALRVLQQEMPVPGHLELCDLACEVCEQHAHSQAVPVTLGIAFSIESGPSAKCSARGTHYDDQGGNS